MLSGILCSAAPPIPPSQTHLRPMRLGVITNRNLRSPWASTHYYLHRALRRIGMDAVHVAGREIATFHERQRTRKKNLKQAAAKPSPFTPELTQAINKDIQRGGYDLLLALHASTIVPALNIDCPLVYVTDATASLLNAYYPKRAETLSQQDLDWLQTCEESTIAQSDAILVPTQWAADSVVHDYGAEADRVHTLEWGGNFNEPPKVMGKPIPQPNATVRFLFVGLDWQRKGGDIAVETIEQLRASGVAAELTVVGSAIPKNQRSRYVHSAGMLNRANAKESTRLDQLFRAADFYLHPARAECYGHVLCEALGFGVPVIATQTGGIPQCVLDGETGLLLDPDSPPQVFASRIQELLSDPTTIAEMRSNAVQDFQRRLSWDCWASRAKQVMQELLSPTVSTSSD